MSFRSANNPIRPSTPSSGRSTHSDQDLIDRQLKHLREEVLPFYPFLLSVPTDVPFRLGNRFFNSWPVSDDGPFTPEEEQLQYMTFFTHDESDSLLVAVGDWSDQTGSVMADPRSRTQSATSTPSNSSTKNKISLRDYKNKRKNGTSPSPLSQEASIHQGTTARLVPSENQPSASFPTTDSRQNISKTPLLPNQYPQSEPKHVDHKRTPDGALDHHTSQVKDVAHAKRRKLSPEPSTAYSKAELKNTNGLPELLSPTLPPTSSSPRLPRLLSPTLPPDLERELAKLDHDSLAPNSQQDDTANSDTTKSKPQVDKSAYSIAHSESRKANNAVTLSSKSPHPAPDMHVLTVAETGETTALEESKSILPSQPSSRLPQSKSIQTSKSRRRLVVKLKYGRPNRKRVEGLLKFSGKRQFPQQGSPAPDASDRDLPCPERPEQPGVSALGRSSKHVNSDRKKKLVASDLANAAANDRTKEPRLINAERPQTPPPGQPQLDKTRPVSITPAEDLKHSSSRHEPGFMDGKLAPRKAPSDLSLVGTIQSPSQSNGVDKNAERRAWKDEYQKYGNLGRDLKHAADRHTAKDRVTNSDEKLAAATAIEAVICFVLAFIAENQSKAVSRQVGDSSTWLSIIAYWKVVRKNSSSYPILHSLCLILGAVSYDAIHSLDLERLAATPIPGEHTPVPTSASEGQPVQSEDSRRSLKDFLDLKNRLPECYKESQRLWLEGSRGLSEDILARELPGTWSKRAKAYAEQGKKSLKAGDYSGEIYLPLRKTSTPLEIVRLGCAILGEWSSKEKINWRSKLDI